MPTGFVSDIVSAIGLKRTIKTGILEFSHIANSAGLFPGQRGCGVIFTLHHVRPYFPQNFEPNAHLEITPEFLDLAISTLKRHGYEFLPLESMIEAIAEGTGKRLLAAFTLDDGYVDNLTYALPVFSKHDVPFTIFACTGLINRTHTMWWETVSQLLRDNRSIDFDSGDGTERLDLSRPDRKYAAYRKLSRFIMETDERRAVATIDAIAASYGINAKTSVEETVMDGEQLKAISSHKLVTIGAHTVSHRALARLAQDEAKAELMQSGDDLEALLGHRPTLFAYPYGHKGHAGKREALLARTCGYRFALTTWEATLTADALTRPTALPRISLNGLFQRQRYVSALASGIPFLGRRSADF